MFIDAPGTGFGKVVGKDKDKAFYGVDGDAEAFAEFITQFLSKYGRWNSPKYLFGESYGTTRSAVLSWRLETDKSIDLNGVILLSQILNFDGSVDAPSSNPGVDLPYELALPTYAATAWYHKKLHRHAAAARRAWSPRSRSSRWATTLAALAAGATINPAQRKAVIGEAAPLHRTAGRVSRQGRSARQRRRVREDAPGRHRPHHGPPRHALLGPDDRSAQQGGRLRSAVGGDQLGVRVGLQRLRAQDAQVRRQAVQGFKRGVSACGTGSTTARPARSLAADHQRDARPGHRDEVQPEPEGACSTPATSTSRRRSTRRSTRCSTCRCRPSCRSNIEMPVLPVGPHGVRERGVAEGAARQRRRVHRAHAHDEVGAHHGVGCRRSRSHARASSIVRITWTITAGHKSGPDHERPRPTNSR